MMPVFFENSEKIKKANNNIQIEKEDYAILRKILTKYQYTFYVYGSRSRGSATRYSDIDVFCKEKIKPEDLVDIVTQLEESNITIKVDLTDAVSCTQEFINIIQEDLIELMI